MAEQTINIPKMAYDIKSRFEKVMKNIGFILFPIVYWFSREKEEVEYDYYGKEGWIFRKIQRFHQNYNIDDEIGAVFLFLSIALNISTYMVLLILFSLYSSLIWFKICEFLLIIIIEVAIFLNEQAKIYEQNLKEE